ncbi:MAG: dihydrofolate reductase [Firmicutes bacterium]|nr:dihydrofolate reductase [Bacillota bacterium]
MNAIVVVDSHMGIGKNNGLLVHLPGDLKYFKERTLGKCVVMGRKTLEGLPGGRPLPGRDHIILTTEAGYKCNERENNRCYVCATKDEAMKIIRENYRDEDVFICGGASVYEQFFQDCDRFYVTHIDEAFEADRFFPPLGNLEKTWESEEHCENGHRYRFCIYERR